MFAFDEYLPALSLIPSRLPRPPSLPPSPFAQGVCSSFAAHFEDYAFGSANVLIAEPGTAAWVVWYSVPRASLGALHAYLRHLLGADYRLDCLEARRLWLDPRRIAEWNAGRGAGQERVPVYRHVQGPGEYIVTDYGSVHWGVNLGVGWKAAVNFAFDGWLPAAKEVDRVYRGLEAALRLPRHYRCAPNFDSEAARDVRSPGGPHRPWQAARLPLSCDTMLCVWKSTNH